MCARRTWTRGAAACALWITALSGISSRLATVSDRYLVRTM